MELDRVNYLAQEALGLILRQPMTPLFDAVKQVLPGDDRQDLGTVTSAARSQMKHVLPTEFAEGNGAEATPILMDRLSFCWGVLSEADSLIRKNRKDALAPVPTTASLGKVFDGILPVKCLSVGFLRALCGVMELEQHGGFLPRYVEFLASKKPKKLDLVLVSSSGEPNLPNLRRLIWWMIRARRERYIEAPKSEPINRIQTDFLVKQIMVDLRLWGGDSAAGIKSLSEITNDEVDKWLAYNCLDVEHAPGEDAARREVVEQFVRRNKLTIRLVTSDTHGSPDNARELAELRKEITRYAEENRNLESQVHELQRQIAAQAKTDVKAVTREPDRSNTLGIQELRDVLKLIDSKYAFDVLQGIQMGEESFLTMKSFMSHLFYALRKKGLVTYPEIDTFDLPYESSGLYECMGFEVPPGKTEKVSVVRPGWALRCKEDLFPIRKAQVKLAE